jgi:glucose-1-phosphate thymidylyltransferase
MKAILPVAGFGTRLKPHTYTTAKVLINVAGKPILQHIMDELKGLGINEAVLIVGYLGGQVKEWATATYPDMKLHFPEQTERKGLGHAILLAEPFVKDEPCLIIFGDTIFDGDIKGALKTKHDGALGCKWVDDPRRWGVVEMQGDVVTRLVEKPDYVKRMPAMVGLNVINNSRLMFDCLKELIKKGIRTKGEYQLTDAFQIMVDRGASLTMFEVNGWYDCGKKETLLETNRFLLEKHGGEYKPRPGVVVIPPVFIHKSAKISNSVIGPFVAIEKDAIVENSIIQNSLIDTGAEISCQMLKDSIVGVSAKAKGSFRVLNIGDSSETE